MLGASHGFDAEGRTTGFVLWINRCGVMVDPPPKSLEILEVMGIPPSSIQSVILTHCHADHDAGTFQKILRTRMIDVYTTQTIGRSFIRKYAAITGFQPDFLSTLFTFKPVKVLTQLDLYGGQIEYFYSFHTIPCVGFKVFYNDQSITYSADTRFDPEMVQGLVNIGKMGKGRGAQLMNFDFNHTVVLHELGVPPIHTPREALLEAATSKDNVRNNIPLVDRLFVVHSSAGFAEGMHQCQDW